MAKMVLRLKKRIKKYKVDLQANTCSSRYWQLAGIPCAHAIASLLHVSSKNPKEYIADCYSIEAYNRTYDHCLLPMEGMEQWAPTDHPMPESPGYVKMPGRPRKQRRREEGEIKKGTKLSRTSLPSTCSRCHKTGHNIRTCSAAPKGNTMRRTLERAKEVSHRPERKKKVGESSSQNELASGTQKKGKKAGENSTHTKQQSRPQKKQRSGADPANIASPTNVTTSAQRNKRTISVNK